VKRRVFFSFHYEPDAWRVSQIRNIGALERNRPVTHNDWEQVKRGGDAAIERWIAGQMKYRSCTVVLVGSDTANRKWINYEIVKSWNDGMGVVGIHIHGLKDLHGRPSSKGSNPFDFISGPNSLRISSIVKCYDPGGSSSTQRYEWISRYLADAVEEAISIRKSH